MALKYLYSGAGGAATGADWANAYLTFAVALAGMAAGDTLYVAQDHSETTAGAIAATSTGTITAPNIIRCVNRAGSVPPVSADLTSGAIVANTGANSITFQGYANCDGIEFRCSDGSNTASIVFGGGAATRWRLGSSSKLTIVSTGANCRISMGSTAAVAYNNEWDGVVVKFGAVGQGISLHGGKFHWRGGSIDPAGSAPTSLTFAVALFQNVAIFEGVDLSHMGSGKTLGATNTSDILFKDCKINAAVTYATTPTVLGGRIWFSRTSGTGISYDTRQYLYAGTEVAVVNVIRTNGSLSSHKIDTTANAKFIQPYRALPLAIYNSATGSNRTVTLYGIANTAAMPLDDGLWMDVEYMGSGASPLGTVKTTAKADVLATGTALVANTSAWDLGATARVNSTTYAVGDVIKVASNPGRVFFCTVGGAAAGSEPAGYATAIDGGTVTDNAATFRAGWRFVIGVILTSPTPGLAGLIYVYPSVGAASAQIYLGRKLELS